MKKIFVSLSLIFFLSLSSISYSDNHYPITKDSQLMIARGKIVYQNNCASCHQVNLSGAENWKGLDEDGHRKAPPLNGTGHTWHHDDETLHKIIKYGLVGIISDYEGKMEPAGSHPPTVTSRQAEPQSLSHCRHRRHLGPPSAQQFLKSFRIHAT